MTIAAYARCNQGLLVCADTEYTHASLKLQGQKIFPYNEPHLGMNVVFAFAGNIQYAIMAIQNLETVLRHKQTCQMSSDEFAHILQAKLETFHQKHIYKHPRYRKYESGDPTFNLLIAGQFGTEVKTWSTVDSGVKEEVADFCAIGAGQEFANYIVRPLSWPSLRTRPLKDVTLVTQHMLSQVKRYVQTCGQTSTFMFIGNDGNFHPMTPWDIDSAEEYSGTFARIMSELFYASADLNMDDESIKMMFVLNDETIRTIREEQKEERDRRGAFLNRLCAMFPSGGLGG